MLTRAMVCLLTAPQVQLSTLWVAVYIIIIIINAQIKVTLSQ